MEDILLKNDTILGIDIGGTKCAIILGKGTVESIDIIDRVSFPTVNEKGCEGTIDRIFLEIENLLRAHDINVSDAAGIGISCGGPLDSKNGIIMSPPNLPGWDNIKIIDVIERRFNVKTNLQNDANACALAEWRYGAGRGLKNVVFLTFGTGMGAGLILDGKLYSGTNDMAGEVGHVRLENNGPVGYGKAGSFEGFCSGGGIAMLAKIRALEKLQMGEKVSFCGSIDELDCINAKIVADAAHKGDALAIEIYKESGNYLGRGLAVLVDILNPEAIIIGSVFARSKDLLWPYAKKVMENESLSYSRNVCKVIPATLGEKIGDYAALAVALI